jgi:hypothetical protein
MYVNATLRQQYYEFEAYYNPILDDEVGWSLERLFMRSKWICTGKEKEENERKEMRS